MPSRHARRSGHSRRTPNLSRGLLHESKHSRKPTLTPWASQRTDLSWARPDDGRLRHEGQGVRRAERLPAAYSEMLYVARDAWARSGFRFTVRVDAVHNIVADRGVHLLLTRQPLGEKYILENHTSSNGRKGDARHE